jgi:hypothetical protein
MDYLVDGTKYNLNYTQLKEDYTKFIQQSDTEFSSPQNLIKALHFACIVLYLKGADAEMTVSDKAIIHQLVHLLDIPDEPLIDLAEIRELFKEVLYLA